MGQDGVASEYGIAQGCPCALCSAFAEQSARAAFVSVDQAPNDPDQGVDALISGLKWATSDLSCSFPNSSLDYAYRGYLNVRDTFQAATEALAAASRAGFEFYASFSGLTFTEFAGAADRDADLMIGRSAAPETAFAYLPFSGDEGGDIWFNDRDFDNAVAGSYAWATVLHEIGHALGLKHGHETGGGGVLPFALDSHEFSLMTYRSFVGASGQAYTNGAASGPQTPMMLDIAAIQSLYGANYGFRNGDDVYAFSPDSGRMLVNGALQEATVGNIVFRTIWDGGGNDTYDFSAYSSRLAIDLTPGGFVDLNVGGNAQRAFLGGGTHARGHVFNALEFEDDPRSLIENAVGGSGADLIRGNRADNRLEGRRGADTLEGLAGSDTLIGGAGPDLFLFDFRDFADRDVDLVLDLDFAEGDRIELLGLAPGGFDGGFFGGAEVLEGGSGLRIGTPRDLMLIDAAAGLSLGSGAGGAARLTLTDGAKTAFIDLATLAFTASAETPAFAPDAPSREPLAPAEPEARTEIALALPPARILGAATDDRMTGTAAAEVFAGRRGDDLIRARGGDDLVRGQAGNDTLRGGYGDDTLNGGVGADRLIGGAGNDVIRGGGGADFIATGRGDDTMAGGAGPDVFLFAGGHGDNLILDFRTGEDRIRIDAGAERFADLTLRDEGGAATVAFANVTIRLTGLSSAALDADDFLF